MWSIATVDFGLTDEQFWLLTPGQWAALHQAKVDSLKFYDLAQAQISSLIVNSSMNKPKNKSFPARKFLIFGKQAKRKLSGKELMEKARGFFTFSKG